MVILPTYGSTWYLVRASTSDVSPPCALPPTSRILHGWMLSRFIRSTRVLRKVLYHENSSRKTKYQLTSFQYFTATLVRCRHAARILIGPLSPFLLCPTNQNSAGMLQFFFAHPLFSRMVLAWSFLAIHRPYRTHAFLVWSLTYNLCDTDDVLSDLVPSRLWRLYTPINSEAPYNGRRTSTISYSLTGNYRCHPPPSPLPYVPCSICFVFFLFF